MEIMADLISRAAAIEICKSIVPNTNPDFYNLRSKAGYGSWMHSNGEVYAITNIEVKIEKLPAVDAVPVRHGQWEEKMEHMGFMCCSVCHDCFVEKEWIFNKKWAWCPQCGARMDGGETDGKS